MEATITDTTMPLQYHLNPSWKLCGIQHGYRWYRVIYSISCMHIAQILLHIYANKLKKGSVNIVERLTIGCNSNLL